ncbi:unnamed protein product [Rangifer tarandus platyrhynchus]|uniref:Uncharacterized protein n=1 Tax=Rangifer tarandus platyrhynchus TaxID=3082113 RepID=A0AC60A309_RANTA
MGLRVPVYRCGPPHWREARLCASVLGPEAQGVTWLLSSNPAAHVLLFKPWDHQTLEEEDGGEPDTQTYGCP